LKDALKMVDVLPFQNNQSFNIKKLKICPYFILKDGQSRTIRQFLFTDWPEQGVPKSGEGFIDFIGQVHKTKEQFGQDGPISVHCRYVLLFIKGQNLKFSNYYHVIIFLSFQFTGIFQKHLI
jgi:hypothetical protein